MNDELRRDVVLITGGSGFLGQHVVKFLLEDDAVKEIRVLDKVEYKNQLGLSQTKDTKPLVNFKTDLYDKEKCREALRGVDVVLHCAALVSYEFPPDVNALHRNNVTSTKNLLELCTEESVPRFVFCSTTEVTLQSCFPGGIISMVVYSQESRAPTPEDENRLIFGEYALSKLRAERIVLAANGRLLKNGGILRTVALRPPPLYGEGDVKLVWKILEVAKIRGNSLLRLSGVGGKQQMAYVGNAAWAFINAKNTLKNSPESISGLPVYITDDTMVENLLRFCERVTRNTKNHVTLSWPLPTPISYLFAFVTELAINYLPLAITGAEKIPFSPRSLVAYLGSIVLHNGSRARIHMKYSPIFSKEEALKISSIYYSKVFDERAE